MNGGACKESFTPWLDIILEEVEAEAAAISRGLQVLMT